MSRGVSDKITYKTYNRGGAAAHSLPETGLHDNQRIPKREAERPDRRNIHIDSEALLNRKNIVGTLQIYKLWERDKEKPQEELIQLWELDVWRRTEEIHMSMRKSGSLQKDSDEEKQPGLSADL